MTHLVLLPACTCGCLVTLVAYEVGEDGVLVERELERRMERAEGERVLAFVVANFERFDTTFFPVSDVWPPLASATR